MAHLRCDGPITASALVSALPDITDFRSGRDLSAWIGLTPGPHSTGGKARLGRISKMGNRYLWRLLCLGAIAQVSASCQRHASSMVPWRARDRLAVEDHPAQEAETGRDCPGQPHGAHRPCGDEEPDGIPGGNRRLTETGAYPHQTARASHRRRALSRTARLRRDETMANDGYVAKDTLFGPERPSARAVAPKVRLRRNDRDLRCRGFSSRRAATVLHSRRRIHGRNRNHATFNRNALVPREPSIHGPRDNGRAASTSG